MSEKMELLLRKLRAAANGGYKERAYMDLCDEAANELAALRASPAEGEAVGYGYSAQIQSSQGEYLSVCRTKVAHFDTPLYTAPPRAAVSPPQREAIAKLPDWQQRQLARLIKELSEWRNADHEDRFMLGRSEIICLLDAILALYSAGDGREADSLSGEKSK